MQKASSLPQAASRDFFVVRPLTGKHPSAPVACINTPSVHAHSSRKAVPESLTLHFTKASDVDRISALFQPEFKSIIDPHGFVTPRSHEEMKGDITRGGAAILVDEDNHIRAFCLASKRVDEDDPKNNYTEIGAVMCDVGGFKAALTIVSALSLRERLVEGNIGRIYSKVARQNDASNAVFSNHLGWDLVKAPGKNARLFDLVYPGSTHDDPRRLSRVWYHNALTGSIQGEHILKTNMSKGYLESKTGTRISLNTLAVKDIEPVGAVA